MESERARTNVVVALVDGHGVEEVLGRLVAAGLSVDESLPEVGVVTGSIATSRLPRLAQLEGVEAVEASREVQLPPPSAPVQ